MIAEEQKLDGRGNGCGQKKEYPDKIKHGEKFQQECRYDTVLCLLRGKRGKKKAVEGTALNADCQVAYNEGGKNFNNNLRKDYKC